MAGRDLTGLIFGKLTVLKKDKKVGYQQYWLCQCECGNKKVIRGSNLTLATNPTRSCGCINKDKSKQNIDLNSLVGKTYGYLTVLERDLTKPIGHGKGSWWICQCKCGNKISMTKHNLINGKNQSCGCLKNKLTSERNFKDLTGQIFGLLTVKERIGQEPNHGSFLWRCECECGNNNYIVSSSNLLSGKIHSCGCNKQSYGEIVIQQILEQSNLNFATEFSFPDLVSKKNFRLRYDFVIFDKSNTVIRLIEFDGEQHYNKNSKFWSQELIDNDQIKNNYALQHQIPLVRIPYSELNNLSLDLIMGDKYIL